MRGFPSVLVAGSLIFSAHSTAAQTTTFAVGSTCSSNYTISGGINLTVTGTGDPANCIASVGKYSGKWYYRVTPTSIGWTNAVGVSHGLPLNGNRFRGGEGIGDNVNSVGYVMTVAGGGTNVARYGPNQRVTGRITYTLGHTIGVAVDMDSNPRQFWVTPDINAATGFGGGPLWNGDVISSPTVPGTGQGTFGPGDTGETGLQFFLVGAFPTITGQNYNGQQSIASFDFTDSTTLDTVIGGSGYLPWNTAGGAASVPGPGNPMVRNIANAPAWQQNTVYTAFPQGDRVLAGPGYNPATGLYTNGQPLWLWAVAPGSGGTSGLNASYATSFVSCPSPANIGGTVAPGGYTSSGTTAWNAATHIKDGGVTWVCLTPVDYNTFTGSIVDDVVNWAPGTPYFAMQFVINSTTGNVYYLQEGTAGPPPAPLTCTSGSTPPSGTTFGTATSDGNCPWIYQGNIGYSSKANVWKHELISFLFDSGPALGITPQYTFRVENKIWWGGYANQVYENNVGGEAKAIFATLHFNQPSDNGYQLTCPGGAPFVIYRVACYDTRQEFTAASGDSFADNMNPASDPLRFNPTKGVAILSNVPQTFPLGLDGGHPDQVGSAFTFDDFSVTVDRLMLQATSGAALPLGGQGPGHYNTGGTVLYDNILNSAGGLEGYSGGGYWSNNIFIFRGTGRYIATDGTPMAFGVFSHYATAFFNNTIIGPDVATAPSSYSCPLCTAIQQDKNSQYGPILPTGAPDPVQNNLAFGWGQGLANWQGYQCDYTPTTGCNPFNTFPFNSGNNATDLLSSYTGNTFTLPPGIETNRYVVVAIPFPGGDSMTCGTGNTSSCLGLHARDVFVNPTIGPNLDLRLKAGSPVIGAGNNFSLPSVYGPLTPGPDIFGQSRTGRSDIGAVQAASGPSAPSAGGTWLFRRR